MLPRKLHVLHVAARSQGFVEGGVQQQQLHNNRIIVTRDTNFKEVQHGRQAKTTFQTHQGFHNIFLTNESNQSILIKKKNPYCILAYQLHEQCQETCNSLT